MRARRPPHSGSALESFTVRQTVETLTLQRWAGSSHSRSTKDRSKKRLFYSENYLLSSLRGIPEEKNILLVFGLLPNFHFLSGHLTKDKSRLAQAVSRLEELAMVDGKHVAERSDRWGHTADKGREFSRKEQMSMEEFDYISVSIQDLH